MLTEVLESIRNSDVKHHPYKYCPITFNASNAEKIEHLYSQFPTVKAINSPTELGRSWLKLSEAKDISSTWEEELDPLTTQDIVKLLYDKLECGNRRIEARAPKYISLLRKILKTSTLESLYDLANTAIQRHAIMLFSRILSFIGLFDDFSIDEYSRLDFSELYWEWHFAEDRDLTKGLPPHTDGKTKVLTLLIPFSLSNEYRPGTSILKPRFRKVASWGSSRYPSFLFEEVYESPHRMGTALAFGKSATTWHCVKTTKQKNKEHRRTLILNVYAHSA